MDRRELIVGGDQKFTFHDANTLAVTRRLPRAIGIPPRHVAFTADGKLMALEEGIASLYSAHNLR